MIDLLTIQCTKKLQETLKVPMSDLTDLNNDPLYSWHAHLFLFKRKKCVLVMNNVSRYNFLLFGLKASDFKQLDQIVMEEMKCNMVADGIDELTVQKYMKNCQSVTYTKTSERTIISQINEMISVVKYWMELREHEGKAINIDEINRKLNRFVMLRLPKSYSGETMKDELQHL